MKASAAAPAIAILGFGALLINTMPVWIAELAEAGSLSDGTAGAMASLVLLCAAVACGLATRAGTNALTWPACAALPLSLGALAAPVSGSASGLVAICMMLGASLGYLSARALSDAAGTGTVRRAVSRSLSIGLVAALLVYLSKAAFLAPVLWILCAIALALAPVMAPLGRHAMPEPPPAIGSWRGLPVWQVPFFTMMGAYWVFLDLYGGGLATPGALAIWLSGSLLTGALGSLLAGVIGLRISPRVARAALICAALTGGLSYIAPTMPVLGLSILANGFFLFLYFPLYLAGPGRDADGAQVALRMATYLLGFAAGGLVGALVLETLGFTGLAAGIALSGLIGRTTPPASRRS